MFEPLLQVRNPFHVVLGSSNQPLIADVERSSGAYAHKLLEEVALLPFSDLRSKTTDTLKALSNLLLVQSDQSLFQAHRAISEYKGTQRLRSEALRILLDRAEINQDAAEEPIPEAAVSVPVAVDQAVPASTAA